jgi:hypothetical protein
MRRFFGTIGFALAGLVSVIAWAAIDSRLCTTFAHLCVPPSGQCGGGVDTCAATAHATVDLIAYLIAPPVLFAVLGCYVFARSRSARFLVSTLIGAVAVHWFVTFMGTRVLHV